MILNIFENFCWRFYLKDLNTRREADSVLSEVHRKQNEAKRMTLLLQSLKELRRLRTESLKSRRGLYTREEDNFHFNKTIGQKKQNVPYLSVFQFVLSRPITLLYF